MMTNQDGAVPADRRALNCVGVTEKESETGGKTADAAKTKRVAILQSDYIPWKGYFSIIKAVDEFIFLDEVQYTKNDWRNRNVIKTAQGLKWLSIPVHKQGIISGGMKISEAKVADPKWALRHWRSIKEAYGKTAYFKEYSQWCQSLYEECAQEEYLCRINHKFISAICKVLGIETKLTHSCDYGLEGGKTERLISMVSKAGGSVYLSGPAARDYIDESLFAQAGITLKWMDYEGYPEYEQPYPPFEHRVSVLDLIFCTGPRAREYL